MPPNNNFRVNAKNFFLTYPRCDLTLTQALVQLRTLQTPTNKRYIKICKETHDDGQPHLHVLIQFEGKFNCRNENFFNLFSTDVSTQFHPNIQGARSSQDVSDYLNKEGNIIDWGEPQADGRRERSGRETANDSFARAVGTGNKNDALQLLKNEQPRDFVINHHNIRRNLDIIFDPPQHNDSTFDPMYHESSFANVPEELQEWADGYFGLPKEERPMRYKSIIIEGDSRTGKTMWARCLGPHNYLSGHLDFNAKCFSNQAEYNVIDDIKPEYLKLKHWKELIGSQMNWQSNCKYAKPVLVTGGIPSIVLCNPGEGYSYKEFLDMSDNRGLQEWTLKNAIFITLSEPLYLEICNSD